MHLLTGNLYLSEVILHTVHTFSYLTSHSRSIIFPIVCLFFSFSLTLLI